MAICPQCGSDDLEELTASSNMFCPECDEVVEPITGERFDDDEDDDMFEDDEDCD